MLKTRVITAIIITLIGLGAVFAMSPTAFALFAAFILLALGGWEGAQLGGLRSGWSRVLFALGLCGLGGGLFAIYHPELIVAFMLPGCILWLGFLIWLGYPDLGRGDTLATRLVKLVAVGALLLTAWLALLWLQAGSPWFVLLLLVVIAGADIGAYFTGRTIGGAKLAPRISPGKTRSGAMGGLVCAMVLTAIAAALLPDSPFTPLQAGLVGLGLAGISIGGDLFISLLKRQRALKDTSGLLPGHGGILDRFDSLGAGLPFFALAVALWGH